MVVANGVVGCAISAHSFIFPYSTLRPYGEGERERERESEGGSREDDDEWCNIRQRNYRQSDSAHDVGSSGGEQFGDRGGGHSVPSAV